ETVCRYLVGYVVTAIRHDGRETDCVSLPMHVWHPHDGPCLLRGAWLLGNRQARIAGIDYAILNTGNIGAIAMQDRRYHLRQDTVLYTGCQSDRRRVMRVCGGALHGLWKRDSSHVGIRDVWPACMLEMLTPDQQMGKLE